MESSISFTANHIKNLQILKKTQRGLVPKDVSFVEFHPEDIDAINTFRKDVTGSRREFYDKEFLRENHMYGLTTQTDSFEKIEPKKILGTITTDSDNEWISNMRLRREAKPPVKLSLIEKIYTFGTIPEGERMYKNVGTALIDGLKCTTDRIAVFSPKKARGFFAKNEFKNPLPEDKEYLIWEKPE